MHFDILLVEDDPSISRILELELKHEGYTLSVSSNGKAALELFHENEYSVILLDLMLPEVSGFEVCRRIRKMSNTPIIMLTARRDVTDKVIGLDLGADDYITKPFELEELLARIRANMRKGTIRKTENNLLHHGDLTLNIMTHECSMKGESVELTKTEFILLQYLLTNKGIVLTRQQIIDNVWGYDYFGDTNVLDVYIRYLRSKLDYIYDEKIIHTVRGVGFTIHEK